MEKIKDYLKSINTETLKESIGLAMNNDEIVDQVFDAMLDEYRTRVDSDEFCNFCESL